jgi:hypothetical protein
MQTYHLGDNFIMMIRDILKPTHILKKDFVFTSDEIYKRGSFVFLKRLHRKHSGFCCNAFFVTKTGRLKYNNDKAVSAFSKDFFQPLKDWFEPLKG